MKRIVLFILTNIAVLIVLSVTVRILGVDQYLTASGVNFSALLVFAAVMGFGGSFISLLMSKPMAKWSTGARVIDDPSGETELWLLSTIARQALAAGVAMPEVAVYEGEPNAFATGASKNNSLVAVSTGLLQVMNRNEVEAVLAHEMSHVANGDMVTLTLIQGVVNTFVIFLARIVGFFVDQALRRNSDSAGPGIGYTFTVIICQIVFGVLASMIVMYFSRQREFRADAGSAKLMHGPQPMIAALRRLGGLEAGELPQNMQAFGIAGSHSWMALFASHPPIEQRIAALQAH